MIVWLFSTQEGIFCRCLTHGYTGWRQFYFTEETIKQQKILSTIQPKTNVKKQNKKSHHACCTSTHKHKHTTNIQNEWIGYPIFHLLLPVDIVDDDDGKCLYAHVFWLRHETFVSKETRSGFVKKKFTIQTSEKKWIENLKNEKERENFILQHVAFIHSFILISFIHWMYFWRKKNMQQVYNRAKKWDKGKMSARLMETEMNYEFPKKIFNNFSKF